MENLFDIVIIGSGPGGYTAAIRAAQLGFKTAIIEKYNNLRGTCTNVGCIPSKALLDSSTNFHSVKTKFANQGIEVGSLKLNFQQMFLRKSEVEKQNVSGINYR